MITQETAKQLFGDALNYDQYLNQHASPGDLKNWQVVFNECSLTEDQSTLVASFTREIHVLCVAGAWCGDCVRQCPILNVIASASDCLNLAFVDRDSLPDDVLQNWTICGGQRVPQIFFFNEDYQFLAQAGDRTLSRYRELARLALGEHAPVAFSADCEDASVVADWVDEFERAHLIARLSPRLRQKHAD